MAYPQRDNWYPHSSLVRLPSSRHYRRPHAQLYQTRSPSPRPGWNIDYATAFLISHLETTAEKCSKELYFWRHSCTPHSLPDCLINLDLILFDSKLWDHISVILEHLGREISACLVKVAGPGFHGTPLEIQINGDMHVPGDRDSLLASLLHQMIHAYFLIVCPSAYKNDGMDTRLAHGFHFGAVMYKIKDLATPNSRRPMLPLDFGHHLGHHLPHHSRASSVRGYRRTSNSTVRGQLQLQSFAYAEYAYGRPKHRQKYRVAAESDACHRAQPTIDRAQIEKFYEENCKPLLDASEVGRSTSLFKLEDNELVEIGRMHDKVGRPAEYVELVFEGKPVRIPRPELERFGSLKELFGEGKRELNIPEGTSFHTFSRLCEFITKTTYEPDIQETQVEDPGDNYGPPAIVTQDDKDDEKSATSDDTKDETPYLRIDTRVFLLASQIGFSEIQSHALDRMNKQHVSREDPVEVLKELYASDEPHETLRRWCRKWLARIRPQAVEDKRNDHRASCSCGSDPPTAETSVLETSNLGLLSTYPSFRTLRDGSARLAEDVTRVETEFEKCAREEERLRWVREEREWRFDGREFPYDPYFATLCPHSAAQLYVSPHLPPHAHTPRNPHTCGYNSRTHTPGSCSCEEGKGKGRPGAMDGPYLSGGEWFWRGRDGGLRVWDQVRGWVGE
ncbi:hypothetical protein M501DRAFT_1017199 [Patellaria atrata CBS 101060]|uniref:SprT-like domain-containing protein n=1 Tax=Patellaria atrata CBS 101060 TaxID=1346257 RepID=A0A9P4SAH8_9PEZI|nr:hypothetical protein M501DRAFT_1017199 [Patellaria atrata CBS 101060]